MAGGGLMNPPPSVPSVNTEPERKGREKRAPPAACVAVVCPPPPETHTQPPVKGTVRQQQQPPAMLGELNELLGASPQRPGTVREAMAGGG